MAVQFTYKQDRLDWKVAAAAIKGTIAGAERAAFQELAIRIQKEGRAEIASAGFSRRWQTGFRTFVFPRRPGAPGQLTLRGQHRIGYANIFERGGTIRGKPLLWVPLPSAPARINGKRTTARAYVQAIGPLHSINRSGRAPLLAGYSMRAPVGGRSLSAAQLRTGQRNARRRQARSAFGGRLGRAPVSVPLFVGLSAVRIADRLNVSAVYNRARSDLPDIYAKHLDKLNR